MANKLRIIRNYDDHDPIVLGTVIPPLGFDTTRATDLIDKLWVEWTEADADADNLFLDWLVEEKQFERIEDDFLDVVVGA